MRILLYVLLFPCWLSAQSDFLKNKDIVWAAEIEQDWIMDGISLQDEFDMGLKTIKILRTAQNEAFWNNGDLGELVHHAAMAGALPIFDDPKCTKRLDPITRLIRTDTIVTFDPETYEEKVKIIKYERIPFEAYKAWRLRQVLYYHQKTSTWNTVVTAIAPLIKEVDYRADTSRFTPLYWFKPSNDRPNISKNNVVWVKETKTRQPATIIDARQTHLVKVSDGFQFPLQHSLTTLINNPKVKHYSPYDPIKLMSMEERLKLGLRIDTLVTFDPETYEEKVVIIRNELEFEDIKSIRLFQTWYWDERKNRLSICTNMGGPIVNVLDAEGNVRFPRPLYYTKN